MQTVSLPDSDQLINAAVSEINQADQLETLEALRVQYLGQKGSLTLLSKQMSQLSKEDKPKFGQALNRIKSTVQQAIRDKQSTLQAEALNKKLQSEKIDVTLPGIGQQTGHLHPITKTIQRISAYFTQLGFAVEEGPEIEDEWHNFEALNIAEHHPARASHDTFYFDAGYLLRTHTSPVQVRHMKNKQPPIAVIAPGRVYRCDSDVTHSPMFHQVEGLLIGENIHFGHLKGILEDFLKYFFEREVSVRFRPSYFPFTEPSAEVDIATPESEGGYISKTGWLEVLGCGMVHPNVLSAVGIDPERYQGFAFGMGVERFAMLRYGVQDLRTFFNNDARFLQQF